MQQPVPLTESPVARPLTAGAPLVRRLPTTGTPNPIVPDRTPSREHWEQLFLAELPTIQRLTSSVARQHRLSAVDADDFASDVHLRLISNDYAVLRKFRSSCNLRTFLTVVICRLCLDYQNARWGKWRPSARSVREGRLAVRLERLTVRDGFTFDEACGILETEDKRAVDRTDLARAHGRFRRRGRPRFVSDEAAGDRTPAKASADEALIVADAQRVVDQATLVLRAALRATPARDRLILKLHFIDGLSIADVARRMGLDQKRLYRRLERVLKRLRGTLGRRGVVAVDVLTASTRPETSLGAVFPRAFLEMV